VQSDPIIVRFNFHYTGLMHIHGLNTITFYSNNIIPYSHCIFITAQCLFVVFVTSRSTRCLINV
jgi:hypothetical protein